MRRDFDLWDALDAWEVDDPLPPQLIRAIEHEQALDAARALDGLAHRCGQRMFWSLGLWVGLLSALVATPG